MIRPGWSRVGLLAMVVVLIVIAYFPFSWSPPRTVRNQVTRNADGTLTFGDMNRAWTNVMPAWLPDVRASGTISVQLQVDPASAGQDASIMMLASDYWHTEFSIGQAGSDLGIWLLRPGSNSSGEPVITVPGVLSAQRWISVGLTVQGGLLRIDVNGQTRLTQRLPPGFQRAWGPGLIALGDEVDGGGPWAGQIRQAEVRSPHYDVDYIRPGALAIPASYLYVPDHIEPFPPLDGWQWVTAVIDLVSFLPFGFLLVLARRRPPRPVPAILVSAVLAMALAAGKFLFAGRHTSMLNVAFEVVGGLLGVLLAARLARAAHGGPLAVRSLNHARPPAT